jgi:lipid-A-disaccharide synthase
MKFFLLSGEPSGDLLGARLIGSLKGLYPDAVFHGVGGALMEKAGMKIVLPAEKLAVMGIWEIIGNFMRLKKIHNDLVDDIESFNADAVITIDFPDFNFLLSHKLKKRGTIKTKLIHYVAPSVWAWRPGRAKAVAKFLDGLMCLFPFEPNYFTPHGLKAECVGHSLVEDRPEDGSNERFREVYKIDPKARTLGLFFGSRGHELEKLGKAIKETAMVVGESYPDTHLIIPTLPHLEYEVLKIIEGIKMPAYVVSKPEDKWDAIAACDAAVAVSGTMGLELAYCGVPHVITYKMHPLTWFVAKFLIKTEHAHLASILLKKAVVPEYLQSQCDALKIGDGILDLIENTDGCADKQKVDFEALRGQMKASQEKMPSQSAAAFIKSILER